jgi:diguanylate cyclase (GGDEF)-like protein/PAS domain S-box-containing protein
VRKPPAPTRRDAARREERREQRLDDLPIAVLVLEGGRVALVNDEWTELTGRSIEESTGETWLDAIHEDDRDSARALVAQPVERDVEGYDWRLRQPAGGSDVWVHARIRHLPDVAAGRCVITITEIDDRKTNELRLLHLATHDPTTGLPNRKLFGSRLEEAIAHSAEGSVTAVLFVDLDHFKAVNDRLGHRVGDLLLIAVAGRIEGTLRPSDLVSRLGGDEFGIVCTGLSGVPEATALASRIVDVLATPFVLDEHVVEMSASVGLAWSRDGGERSPAALVEAADRAMYHAKANGGSQWHLFDDSHDGTEGGAERAAVADRIAAAVQRLHGSIRRAEQDALELIQLADPNEDRTTAFNRASLLIERARTLIETAPESEDDRT